MPRQVTTIRTVEKHILAKVHTGRYYRVTCSCGWISDRYWMQERALSAHANHKADQPSIKLEPIPPLVRHTELR